MSLRLLLIEDNPGDAVIFRDKLGASSLDASVAHVARLQDALDRLGGGGFDLVLVDLSLPDAQGLEAVDRVRRTAPHLPLVVLTGLDDAATAAEAKKRGAVDYLVKWYVDSEALARYIRYAVAQYRPGYGSDDAAPAPAPARPTAPPSPAASGGGGEGASPSASPSASPAVTGRPAAPAPLADGDAALLVPALEAALEGAERTAALADHLAGSLRAALALARREEAAGGPPREAVDVLALARQAADGCRPHALQRGIPVRVSADAKKVMATADRRALGEMLDRLVVLTLATGGAAGVRLTVAAAPAGARLTVAWELRRGARLDDTEDPLLALDLALCRRLAARAGAAFTLAVNGPEAEAVVRVEAAPRG